MTTRALPFFGQLLAALPVEREADGDLGLVRVQVLAPNAAQLAWSAADVAEEEQQRPGTAARTRRARAPRRQRAHGSPAR